MTMVKINPYFTADGKRTTHSASMDQRLNDFVKCSRWTDGHMDGQTHQLIEMRGRI